MYVRGIAGIWQTQPPGKGIAAKWRGRISSTDKRIASPTCIGPLRHPNKPATFSEGVVRLSREAEAKREGGGEGGREWVMMRPAGWHTALGGRYRRRPFLRSGLHVASLHAQLVPGSGHVARSIIGLAFDVTHVNSRSPSPQRQTGLSAGHPRR